MTSAKELHDISKEYQKLEIGSRLKLAAQKGLFHVIISDFVLLSELEDSLTTAGYKITTSNFETRIDWAIINNTI